VPHRFDDGCTQKLGEARDVHLQPSCSGHVAHVERQYERTTEFDQLRRQVEVPFEVGSVDDVDHEIRLYFEYEVSGDEFFDRVGGQAVGAGQVHDAYGDIAVSAGALPLLDGGAGIVGHLLACAGEVVEDGALAGVRVADERDGDVPAAPADLVVHRSLVLSAG